MIKRQLVIRATLLTKTQCPCSLQQNPAFQKRAKNRFDLKVALIEAAHILTLREVSNCFKLFIGSSSGVEKVMHVCVRLASIILTRSGVQVCSMPWRTMLRAMSCLIQTPSSPPSKIFTRRDGNLFHAA